MTDPACGSMINSGPIVGAPGWRLSEQNGYLVAIAGADEIWVVDDVPGSIAEELSACWTAQPPTPDQLSTPARYAVEQLRAVGVFGTPNPIGLRPSLGILTAGRPAPGLEEELAGLCRRLGWPEPVIITDPDDGGGLDVMIIVRTTDTLIDTAARTEKLIKDGRLHLLCDLASARTVALGPFVVPGHSACIGCLAGRVANRWGDPQPPEHPGAAGPIGTATAAALIIGQLQQAGRDSFPLVDAAASFDLETLESRVGPCLRSAQCPYCADRLTDGRVELPWAR